MIKMGKPFYRQDLQGSQHLKGRKIIYAIFSFFIVLALICSILNSTLQSLIAFLTGNIANQPLLVQNIHANKL